MHVRELSTLVGNLVFVAAAFVARPDRLAAADGPPPAATTSEIVPLAPYTGPSVAAPDTAPAVAILPPIIADKSSADVLRAAEAACDRLSGEIAAGGKIQVVNRSELKQVLEECKVAGNKRKPLTSYSALVRLEVLSKDGQPKVDLRVVDLSSGNVLGRQEYDWPLKETDVPGMKQVCVKGVAAADGQKDKVRIRLLGVIDIGESIRLVPLAHRISFMYGEALTKSPDISLLQHLEARTTKEESLLLLMGLSRLPGTSRFVPQADAIIELRLLERDAVGKTFPETPVAIGVRLTNAGTPRSEWTETAGPVKDLDRLMETSWKQLALSLKSVRPEELTRTLNEFQLRRKQAEAELRSARSRIESKQSGNTDGRLAQIDQAIAHCETALKLDPTFAKAQFQLAATLHSKMTWLAFNSPTPPSPEQIEKLFRRIVVETARYLEHPAKDTAQSAGTFIGMAFSMASRRRLLRGKSLWEGQHSPTPEDVELLRLLKSLLVRGMDGGAEKYQAAGPRKLIPIVHEGMRRSNVPRKERVAFLLQLVGKADTLFPNPGHQKAAVDILKRGEFLRAQFARFRIRLDVAELLIEDAAESDARRLLLEARNSEIPDTHLTGSSTSHIQDIRKLVAKLNDPQLLKDFNMWKGKFLQPEKPAKVGILRVRYHETLQLLNQSEDNVAVPSLFLTRFDSTIDLTQRFAFPKYLRVEPLAAAENRVYLLVEGGKGKQPAIAYIPLDKEGAPVGVQVEIYKRRTRTYHTWNNFHFLPDSADNSCPAGQITQAQVDSKGRLIVAVRADRRGDRTAGLAIFSPDTERWTTIGPDEGLRTNSVLSFFPLDNDRLYCAGVANEPGGFFYGHSIVDVGKSEVKLLHRSTRETDNAGLYLGKYLKPMWWVEGKLNGPGTTDLLSDKPQKRSGFMYAASYKEIDGRRFVSTRNGSLHEYDAHEKIVRRWRADDPSRRTLFQYVAFLPSLGTSPARHPTMARSGEYLVFQASHGDGMLLFHPETDTWYGPVGDFRWSSRSSQLVRQNMIGTPQGVWMDTPEYGQLQGARYVNTADVVRVAMEAGRVQTTQQYQQAQRQKIDKLPLQNRAIARVMQQDWKRAGQDLATWLDEEPESAEAVFLSGVVHEHFALKKPQTAMRYHKLLVELPDPSAQLTGMLLMMEQHRRANRWQDVVDTGDKILSISLGLPNNVRPQVTYRIKVAREQLQKAQAGNKPSATKSN